MRYLLTAAALVGALFLGVSPVAASAAQPNIICQGKLFCNSCHLNGLVLICTDSASQAASAKEATPAAAQPKIICKNFLFCNTCEHFICTATDAAALPMYVEVLRSFEAAAGI